MIFMNNFLLILRHELALFFVAVTFIIFSMGAVYIDVTWMSNSINEYSVTEITQELILAIISCLFFFSSVRRMDTRGGLILIGGFYLCMLIRELDAIFDMIRHGSWLWFALAAMVISIILSLRNPESVVKGLSQFIRHRTWLMTATGLIIVLVFSRLIGMNYLWKNLMLNDYNRIVKNMAEEASELFGYSICFISSVFYLIETREKFNNCQNT